MKYLLPALLMILSSCAIDPSRRVDIVLRNKTERPIQLRARTGFFGKNLQLSPGEVWCGWVPRDFVTSEIVIEVREEKKE